MRTAVKICGITREEDAMASAYAGAHAIGFVFFDGSARSIGVKRASQISARIPPFVTPVALFVNPAETLVREVLKAVRPGILQFHGDESAEYCSSFGAPFIKAIRVRPGVDLLESAKQYKLARGLLLDAFQEGVHGGTGTSFDWALIPSAMSLPVILSGGLGADNVELAVRKVRPWAVDVSSGVEASKGIKDAAKIAEFIRKVRNADL